MARLLLLGLALALAAGCKKAKPTDDGSQSPGTLGGAITGVHKAAKRPVTGNDLRNLHIYINNYSGPSGQMPTVQEITAVVQREMPQLHQQLVEQAVFLTGTRSRENIWAYTAQPQLGNQHLVVTASGVDQMGTEELRQRLQQQQGQ